MTKNLENLDLEPLLEGSPKQMAMPKRKITKVLKIGAIVAVISIILIILAALSLSSRKSSLPNAPNIALSLQTGNVAFDEFSNSLVFSDSESSERYLTISLPHKLKNFSRSKKLCKDFYSDFNFEPKDKRTDAGESIIENIPQLCLAFEDGLYAAVYQDNLEGAHCHNVHWVSRNLTTEVTNCVNFGVDNWYGGGSLSVQRWPLNRVDVHMQPYITQKMYPSNENADVYFDSFIEPYFISSSGTVVMVDSYLPLFVSINHNVDKKLCFTSAYKPPYSRPVQTKAISKTLLSYQVCKDRTAKTLHWHLLENKALSHSTVSPPVELFHKPVWSTRGLNVKSINQSIVLSLVGNIKQNKLPYSQLFIDGNYSKSRGNFYFNDNRFPHSQQIIMELEHELNPSFENFHVGTEVFPYIPTTPELEKFSKKNKLYSYLDRNTSYLDVENKEAVAWYTSHLKDISKELTITGFRFSGGQGIDTNLWRNMEDTDTQQPLQNIHPNLYTQRYAEIASDFGDRCFLGSGYKSQEETRVADAGPMLASWDHGKGIKSLIPTVLTYGLMGYPFVNLGPVGGVTINSEQSSTNDFAPPEKELFIRWLQLAIFLPVVEFSTGPWVYGEEVVNYTRKLLEYRRKVLWPKYMSSAVQEAVQVGTPILRPLWFISPWDETAQFIDCEFFVSNMLLVAPVLNPEARKRDVYLPKGPHWKDELRGTYHEGGQWLRGYDVGLYEIATFTPGRPPKTEVL
ncbi:myogenesis-regulating glycosidase-like [Physella acuta]|uniref:myogenesis-regulating glycosidase-like n=1 Tax=Physella acuta TaxID=109671 RepID=UPI0027DD083D|nr:myogenesis-regulating glycosidase-like [Physella acuta]